MAMRRRNIPMTYKRPMAAAPAAITVRRRAGEPTQGVLTFDGHAIPVALGRGGLKANKREGDGCTPIGTFRPLRLWWRKDRHARPKTSLPVRAIQPPRRLVRGPVEPPLQSAGPSCRGQQRRSADARRSPLRLHRRDRSQHAPAHRRPRQRGVSASRAAGLRTDRRLHRDDARVDASPAGAALAGERGLSSADYATCVVRCPKIADPTRIWVAPI